MRSSLLAFTVFIFSFALSADEFNVKKFGAKGDGQTDDTAAVQAAVQAAHKNHRMFRKYGKYPQSSYFGTTQKVIFPRGVYKITKTIRCGSQVSLAGGDGIPMILWAGEENGVVFDFYAWINQVEKLIFTGGGTQLRFSNRNIDKTMITIRDCQFYYASQMSVLLEPGKDVNHLSAQTLIEGCLFAKNFRCVQNCGDLMEIRNCWVDQTQPQMADGAAFINRYGTMRISFCCLTPSANPDKGPLYYHNARWVDNYDRFEAESVRFGGEGGGLPAVYNYVKNSGKSPFASGRILIRNCMLCCGQLRRENGAVIRLFGLPSRIILENNYQIGLVPYLVSDPSLDLEAEIKNNPAGTSRCRFHISNNQIESSAHTFVPQELQRFFTKESDCRFAKYIPRKIPAEITDTRKNKTSAK